MTLHRVLPMPHPANSAPAEPDCFGDLNLGQVVDAITTGRQTYDLKPFFYAPLRDPAAVARRQAVFRELEDQALFTQIEAFARRMTTMRTWLGQADRLHHKVQKERWFLDAAGVYCEAVQGLAADLAQAGLTATDLLAFRDDLARYAASDAFQRLASEARGLALDLGAVRYTLDITVNSVTVRKEETESDYSAEIAAAFAKFRQRDAKQAAANAADGPEMNPVEAGVLDRVALLYPELFARLEAFCANNATFWEPGVLAFDREIQFYMAYLEHAARFRRAGLAFCYPDVSADDKAVYSHDGYDLALAHKLVSQNAPVVVNDFRLDGQERILVVTGPNQSGKTTFARAFGQLHYLASLGCPVPGTAARLFLFDQLLTHFERHEVLGSLRGKLQDDLMHIHTVLRQATPHSVVILNEIFTSTALSDSDYLSRQILEQITRLDLLCVCVTFLDQLAALSEKTVSMVSGVDPVNPHVRTFRLTRRPPAGFAQALVIARWYGLDYDSLKERLAA